MLQTVLQIYVFQYIDALIYAVQVLKNRVWFGNNFSFLFGWYLKISIPPSPLSANSARAHRVSMFFPLLYCCLNAVTCEVCNSAIISLWSGRLYLSVLHMNHTSAEHHSVELDTFVYRSFNFFIGKVWRLSIILMSVYSWDNIVAECSMMYWQALTLWLLEWWTEWEVRYTLITAYCSKLR